MQLHILDAAADSVRAGYECPCGCRPSVTYERASDPVHDGCCCGNEFAIGPEASTTLTGQPGYRKEAATLEAPWGETIEAAWLVGPSVHAEEPHGQHDTEADSHSHHAHGDDAHGSAVDPVCGMTVDIQAAEAKGLQSTLDGRDYYFCGRGCKLEFDDDPKRYIDPSYVPSM